MCTPDPDKSSATSSEDHCLAPFIIGITGNTDPTGYGDTPEGKDILALQGKIRAVFQWAQASDGYLDPVKGVYVATQVPAGMEPWRALGLNDTPIIVLSSLAPGADTLVAEQALAWSGKKPHSLTVRAPLPFPEDIYKAGTTFASDRTAQVARFDSLMEKSAPSPASLQSATSLPWPSTMIWKATPLLTSRTKNAAISVTAPLVNTSPPTAISPVA